MKYIKRLKQIIAFSVGAKSAALTIPSNDPDENPLSVSLTNTEASPSSGGGGGGGGGGVGCFITTVFRCFTNQD